MAARDKHLVHLAGVQVPAPQLHRPDARAMLDGHITNHVTS